MQLTKLRAAPVLRAEVPPCAPAGQTDGGTASELIRSVGQTLVIRRTAGLAFVAFLTLACDKMISDRFVVTVGSELGREVAPGDRVAETIRAAFATCQLQNRHVSSYSNTIAWRDPEHLPGLRVSSQHEGGVIEVRLAQDLMGPVGATDAYECVKGTLRQQLEGAFGKGQVRVAS